MLEEIHKATKNVEATEKDLLRERENNATYANVYFNLSSICTAKKEKERAKVFLQKAILLNPSSPNFWKTLQSFQK